MLGEAATYSGALLFAPWATEDVVKQIRGSRSVHKNDPVESFEWRIRTSESPDDPRVRKNAQVVRVTARKSKLTRISSLYYVDTGEEVPGLWSF